MLEKARMRTEKWGFLKHLFLSKKWLKRCFHFMNRIVIYSLEGPLGSTWLWPLREPAAFLLIVGPVSDHGERADSFDLPFSSEVAFIRVFACRLQRCLAHETGLE